MRHESISRNAHVRRDGRTGLGIFGETKKRGNLAISVIALEPTFREGGGAFADLGVGELPRLLCGS